MTEDTREGDSEAQRGAEPVESEAAKMCQFHQRAIRPAGRVMFCGRCGHATGGSYGHYTSWCKVTGQLEEGHMCCPESCALVDGREMDPTAPCHPAPGDYKRWARETDAAREQA